MSKNLTKMFAVLLMGSMALTGCASKKNEVKPDEKPQTESSAVEESSEEQSSEVESSEVSEVVEQNFNEFLDAFMKAYDEGDIDALRGMCTEDVFGELNLNDAEAMKTFLMEKLGSEVAGIEAVGNAADKFSVAVTADAVREYEIVDVKEEDGKAEAVVEVLQGLTLESIKDIDMASSLKEILATVKETNMEEMSKILEEKGEAELVKYLYEKAIPELFDKIASEREGADSVKYEKTIRAERQEDGSWKVVEFTSEPVGTSTAD